MPRGLFKRTAAALAATAAATAAFCAPTQPGLPEGHPAVAHPGRTLFELIAADIAIHRGDANFAYSAWMDAAKNESSAELARLAWETAGTARNHERTVAAAKLWLEIDPAATSPRLTLLADAVERGERSAVRAQIDELARRSAADGDADPSEWLVTLFSGLHGLKNPAGLRAVAEETEPYARRYADRAEVRIGRARLIGRLGERAKACRLAAEAVGMKPSDREILGQAADVCWQAGDMQKSRSMLESYLKKHPDDSYALLVFGRVEERLGRRASAVDALERAMRQPLDDARIAYNAGELAADLNDAPRTEKYLGRYIEMLREESPEIDLSRLDVWLKLGAAALMQKAPERAAGYYAELRSGPFAVDARIRQALALTDCGRPEEALEALRRGREELKLDAPALMGAESKLLLELGRNREAVKLIREAADAYPSEPDVLYDAAMIEEETGSRDEAERRLRALLEISPDHIQAVNALGYLLADDNRSLREARGLLERAYRARPLDPYILDSMGWLCYREGRYRAAAEFTGASLKRMWDDEVALHLIEILAVMGRTAQAQETLDEYLHRGGDEAGAKRLAERWKLTLPAGR